MELKLSRDEIETLLVGLHLINYEMDKSDSLIFDYDKITVRDGKINNLYSKLSECIYLDEHLINKL